MQTGVPRHICHAILLTGKMTTISMLQELMELMDINLAQPLYEAQVFVTYKRLQRKHSLRGCVRDRGPGIPTYIPTFRAGSWLQSVAAPVNLMPHSGPQWPTHPPRGSELPDTALSSLQGYI